MIVATAMTLNLIGTPPAPARQSPPPVTLTIAHQDH